MFDCLHLSHLAYPGLFSLHLFIVSIVLRGSLVFSVVILVFVLVVQYISFCKCRFLDCYLLFLRFTLFSNCWLHFFVRSLFVILFVPLHSCQRQSLSLFISFRLSLPFYPSVCKWHVSMRFHPRAQKEVLVNVRSVDINLIDGSLKLQEMSLILEEQTSQPPRNQSGTVQVPFCSWVRLTFLVRQAQRMIVVSL